MLKVNGPPGLCGCACAAASLWTGPGFPEFWAAGGGAGNMVHLLSHESVPLTDQRPSTLTGRQANCHSVTQPSSDSFVYLIGPNQLRVLEIGDVPLLPAL